MLNTIVNRLAIVFILVLTAIAAMQFLPFSWWVQVDRVEWPDLCVGDTLQAPVVSYRTAVWDIPGSAYGQAIKFTDDVRLETTIFRGSRNDQIDFTYESDFEMVSYGIEWNTPFTTPGVYGVQDTVTIYPLPGVETTHVFLAEDNTFNVIECQ